MGAGDSARRRSQSLQILPEGRKCGFGSFVVSATNRDTPAVAASRHSSRTRQ